MNEYLLLEPILKQSQDDSVEVALVAIQRGLTCCGHFADRRCSNVAEVYWANISVAMDPSCHVVMTWANLLWSGVVADETVRNEMVSCPSTSVLADCTQGWAVVRISLSRIDCRWRRDKRLPLNCPWSATLRRWFVYGRLLLKFASCAVGQWQGQNDLSQTAVRFRSVRTSGSHQERPRCPEIRS